ncbi:MAG: transcriptional repressor [Oscillospiraceae bacterium]|nr:transcriptional repressor [Oscillospiraceae bacterium]
MATPKTYHTQQHKAILSFVSQQKNCFTAAELSDALRAAGEKVGLATIYRQLEKLEKSGMLQRIVTEEGAYWQCCEQDDHDCFLLKCEHCGRISHVDCLQLAPLYDHLSNSHHFAINPRRTMLYGVCGSCGEASHA